MARKKLDHLHMIINGKIRKNYGQLTKRKAQALVDEILSASGMKPLGGLSWASAKDLDFPGQSFVQMITTSHCSMHYFSDDNEIYFDLYSCKSFEPDAIVGILKKRLGMRKWRGMVYDRKSGMQSSLVDMPTRLKR